MRRVIRPAARIFLSLLGLALVAGAFIAVLSIGAMTNKPTLKIAVAVRDLNVGERLQLGDFRIEDQIIDPRLARLYVQSFEADKFINNVIVDVVRRGDPLNKIKLANGDDALATRRYTLVLTDANDILMTIPVNPDIIPPNISSGDHVNILFIAGDESGTRQLPTTVESAADVDSETSNATAPSLPTPGNGDVPTAIPTPTATPVVSLPLADVLLQRVLIIDVIRQRLQNPNYGSGENTSDQPYMDGPISGIVVKVPVRFQTLLGFGIASSKLRFSIAAPIASDNRPEMGMDWNTYMQFYHWKQEQAAARGDTVEGAVFPSYQPITTTAQTSTQANGVRP